MTETGERSDREGSIYLDPLQVLHGSALFEIEGTNKSTCVDEVRVMNFSERRGVFCNPFLSAFRTLPYGVVALHRMLHKPDLNVMETGESKRSKVEVKFFFLAGNDLFLLVDRVGRYKKEIGCLCPYFRSDYSLFLQIKTPMSNHKLTI